MSAPVTLTVEIWSDVMCPWCVVGYYQLQKALRELEGEIAVTTVWRPFELNPDMPPEGETFSHLMLRKHGRQPDSSASARMREMAAEAGYDMRWHGEGEEPERRMWNTLGAHKLLRRALEADGPLLQTRLKLALFDAHFQQHRDVSDPKVLLELAGACGLPCDQAAAALEDEALAAAIRAEEREAVEMGITGVPAMLVEGRFMIPGAQEPAVYVASLRRVASRLQAG